MKTWKVAYIDIETRDSRRPFYKWHEVVEAHTRKEAIKIVSGRFSPPKYGEYKASVIKE